MTETIKEYAEALFLLAEENKRIAEYSESLAEIGSLLAENPEYIDYLSSPALPLSERLAAIDEAFADSNEESIISFLKLLCEHARIRGVLECIEEFEQLKRAKENRTTARVTSAIELSETQKAALCQKLEKVSGRAVDAVYTVDAAVLGGIKVEMEGLTLDGSTKKRLNDIKGVMTDE